MQVTLSNISVPRFDSVAKRVRHTVGCWPSITGTNATDQVGFTAVLTHDLTLGPLQTLEYDKVHTNIGNGYDSRHGIFTVPINGLYIVSATTCSGPSQGVRTEIVRNGIQLAALYGDDYDIASHTIVVSLEQNDEVWVRHFAEGTSTVHAGGDRYYSSFSGVLVAAF
ncbi:C1QL [Mytilus edulis]|uniref:C1QL n=1 Tax=Mytilus edulis TaxID=6550 RepID=A0A8S3UTC5_MYTED|nr:C1QL [Mytilus edulis]